MKHFATKVVYIHTAISNAKSYKSKAKHKNNLYLCVTIVTDFSIYLYCYVASSKRHYYLSFRILCFCGGYFVFDSLGSSLLN